MTTRHRKFERSTIFALLLTIVVLSLSALPSQATCPPFQWTTTCNGTSDCLLYLDTLQKCGTTYRPALNRCDVFINGCSGIGGIVYGHNIESESDCTLLGVTIFSCPGSGGGGGCADPPAQHGPVERLGSDPDADAEKAKKNPIIGIAGGGIFADNQLVLLYDDGFAQGTTHRLSFATMVSHGEPAAPVYTAGDLLRIFEKAYDGVTIEVAAPRRYPEGSSKIGATDNVLRNPFAVLELPNGWKIGLVNELHRESWYVSQKEYSQRYIHGKEQFLHSPGPSAPVTLNLTTIYVEDKDQWVSDPLLVLEALEEFFVPTPKQHDRLIATLYGS